MNTLTEISLQREQQLNNLRALLKDAEKEPSPFYTLQATKKRIGITARLFRKAYRKDSVVAWRTSFVPSEILFALGIVPFAVEGVISMFANSNLTAEILAKAEENYSSRDACSFLRGTYGAAIANYLPTPDFLICTSLYCDASAKTFYSLSKMYNKPFFYIDVPYDHASDYSLDYVAKQLESIATQLAKKTGQRIDYDKLGKTIEYSNEAREYFEKVLKLRETIPSPMLGGEAIDYAILLAHTWGLKEAADVYKMLYMELKDRVDKGQGALDEEKFRLIWRQLRPYYTDDIFRYLELEQKAVIVFEEANYIHWEWLDPKKPFQSLARKLLSNPPLGPFNRWMEKTVECVDRYQIDGIVEFAQWGCRHLNSGTQILKETLRKRNIPMLVLDGDCVDRRDYSRGQIKTRLEAFLEILETNNKRGR